MHPESVTVGAALAFMVGVVLFLVKRLFFTADKTSDHLAQETKDAITSAVTAIEKVATEIRLVVDKLSAHATEIAKLTLRMERAESDVAGLRERQHELSDKMSGYKKVE